MMQSREGIRKQIYKKIKLGYGTGYVFREENNCNARKQRQLQK